MLSGSSRAHLGRLFGIQPLGAGTEKGSARCSLSLALCQRSEAERSSSSCSANSFQQESEQLNFNCVEEYFSLDLCVETTLVGTFVADAAPIFTLKIAQVIVNSS